jgi:cyanate lyase
MAPGLQGLARTPECQPGETAVTKSEMTQAILSAKQAKGLTWEALGQAVGKSPVWVASACLGMNSMPEEHARSLCTALDLPDAVGAALEAFPMKEWDKTIPTDPVIYRFYELVGVYGPTIKEIIHEKFGDGIMSAIDFSMDIAKQEDPKGNRVVITLNGKFLPYKSW